MRKAPSLLALLSESWIFLRKQPVLVSVLFWFIVIPGTLMEWVIRFGLRDLSALLSLTRRWQLSEFFCVIAIIVLCFVIFWGISCLLFVGRRMIQNKAGRARTSMRTVSACTRPLLPPLFLTGLLQLSSLFYRSLFFVIPTLLAAFLLPLPATLFLHGPAFLLLILLLPALLYFVRSAFFPVTIVCEDLSCRAALRRSLEVTRRKSIPAVADLIALTLITLLPGILVFWSMHTLPASWPLALILCAAFLSTIIATVSITFFTFGYIALYGKLRNMPQSARSENAPQRIFA